MNSDPLPYDCNIILRPYLGLKMDNVTGSVLLQTQYIFKVYLTDSFENKRA